jgi:hypothetical protein
VRRQEITIGVAGAVEIGLNGELVATVPANYYSSLRSYEVQKNLSFPRGNPENLCTSSNKNRCICYLLFLMPI